MRAIFLFLAAVNLLVAGLLWFASDPEPADTPLAASGAGSEAPELQRIGELPTFSQADFGAPGAETLNNRAPVTAGTEFCSLLGPYSEPSVAESAAERLMALDADAQVRALEVSDGPGYWVHLPPEPSERAALARLHEIQARQIDSYIIPRGDLAQGISFGMFSRESLARQRRDSLRELGYEARIREIERSHTETWVVVPLSQARSLGDSLWEELLAEAPGLERRQNFCPGVASE